MYTIMKRVLVPFSLMFICFLSSLNSVESAVSCNTVIGELYPCVSYVTQGGVVPTSCCNGVRMLNGQAQTSVDRQSICRCIKSAVGGIAYTPSNLNNALSLPAKCGVNLPYKISPSTNCDSIN